MPEQSLERMMSFVNNPEPRCPCVLLLDTSESMAGEKIAALNQGIQLFKMMLVTNRLASRRIEVAILTFDDSVRCVSPFTTADQFVPPQLTAQGKTHMGSGISGALDALATLKSQYRNNGISYFRPWVLMITDGEPKGEATELTNAAFHRVRQEEERRSLIFYAVGVMGANMRLLSRVSHRPPVLLDGLNFNDMFTWLSSSMQQVSRSRGNDQVNVPPIKWGRPT